MNLKQVTVTLLVHSKDNIHGSTTLKVAETVRIEHKPKTSSHLIS
jgi:hypothetical protein